MKQTFIVGAMMAAAQATIDFGNLPNIDLAQFEESTFTQWISHFDYLDNSTYEQRYWKSDQYWDGKGPIFIYICGEYRCTVPDTRLYPFMVGSQYNAQFMVLEHRFYGESQPFDEWTVDNLQYLNSELGMADLANFIASMNTNNVEVMVVGGSYPGALSAWFRSRYPHLTVGSWASSAVVQPIVDFQQYDEQSYTSTLKSGTFCPDMISSSMSWMTTQAVERDAGNDDNYITKNLASSTVPTLRSDDWLSYYADIVAGAVQYGNRTSLCNWLLPYYGMDQTTIADAIVGYGNANGESPNDYDRLDLSSTTVDTNNAGRPWSFQYCTEYGWYQTMSTIHPMRSSEIDVDYFSQYCSDIFGGMDMTDYPKVSQTTNSQGGTDTAGSNIFFGNGGEDPWQWATLRESKPEFNIVSRISDCTDCGHCSELYTPKVDDPQELKDTRIMVDAFIADLITYRVPTTGFTQENCDTENANYVPELPGFVDTYGNWVCSYAGTLPSNADATHNLFYWMYPAETDADAPVIIFINGGPGASSTFANFLFSSPLRIAESADSVFTMYKSAESWTNLGTVIFIDQPVGTGFSYGMPLLTTMEDASDEFRYFVKQIWAAYPDLQGKDLYLMGESYAGHYIPQFSLDMVKDGDFNLKASLMGDPYTDGLSQKTEMHRIPEALNLLDDSNMNQIAALRKNCQENLVKDFDTTYSVCSEIMTYIEEISGNVFAFDQRIFAEDWDVKEDPVVNYFTVQPTATLNQIYESIHVEDSTKVPVFEMSSSAVNEAFVGDKMINYASVVQELIETESPLLLYAGEFDAQDGPAGINPWLELVQFDGSDDFWSQSRQIYWAANFTELHDDGESNYINGGYYRTSANFEYLTTPKSGHFVPANYFSVPYQFLSDYISNQKLQCNGVDKTQCSVVQERCSAMNYCNGHGSCDSLTGQCICDAGYKFADCSKKSAVLNSDFGTQNLTGTGPMWYSMTYAGTGLDQLELTPDQPTNFYISQGSSSDPNNFSNDYEFMNVNSTITFNFKDLGWQDGFAVAAYVDAYNATSNSLLDYSLGAKVITDFAISSLAPTFMVLAAGYISATIF